MKEKINIFMEPIVEKKKKFHLIDETHLDKYESIRDDKEFMANVLGPVDTTNLYKIDFNDKEPVKVTKINKSER